MLGRVVYGQLYSGPYGSTALTEQKAIQYNVLGEPTQVQVIDEAQSGKPSVTTTASYDDLGRLTTLIDPDRGTHTYTYDADGRLITDASSLVTLGYSYDLMGRLGCVQDQPPPSPVSSTGACSSSGVNPFAQYTYDVSAPGANWSGNDYPKGRLTQTYAINYFPSPDNTQGKVTEQTQYDARGRAINENLLVTATGGTLTFPTFPTYKLNLQYNDANQVTSAQTSSSNPGGLGYTAAPIYDSMTGVEVGLGTTVSTSPNVASITYNAQALISSINFLANSTTTVASESFQYDGDLRPNSANACWQTACTTPPNCPSAAFFCQGMTYDAASNLINLSTTQAAIPNILNSGGSQTQVFCYDEQNRMVWAGNNNTQQPTWCTSNGTPGNTFFGAAYHAVYTYNNLGQITTGPYNGTGASQQYLYCDSNHPHALTIVAATSSTCPSQTSTNYTASYDAHGNMTSRATKSGTSLDTQTLSFDGQDHLVRWNDTVTTSNEEWYMYDASGNRILQRSTTGSGAGNTTITVYAFGLEEHAYNGSGTLTSSKYYYSLGGHLLGKTSGAGAPTFFLTDLLGSVLADFSGASGTSAVSGNQTFGPYGNLQYFKGSMGTLKGFTGQYQDDLSGLHSFGARYYDHLVGTFVSADTVQGNLSGDDPYTYVGGNPENFSDPSGLRAAGPIGSTFVLPPTVAPPPAVAPPVDIPPVDIPPVAPGLIACAAGIVACIAGIAAGFTIWASVKLMSATGRQPRPQDPNTPQPQPVPTPTSTSPGGFVVSVAPQPQPGGFAINIAPQPQPTTQTGSGGRGNIPPVIVSAAPAPCSFTSNTPVTTDHGKKAIGNLHVGDKVLAYNPKTHNMEQEPILHIWIHTDNDLVDLSLTSTSVAQHGQSVTITSEVIHTNQKHPFFTREKGFLAVGQIKLGMHILRADRTYGVVTGWKIVPGTSVMYNLEVAQDHTFTVGTDQWIVHNCTSGRPHRSDEVPARVRQLASMTDIGRIMFDAGPRMVPGGVSTPNVAAVQVEVLDGSFNVSEVFESQGLGAHAEKLAISSATDTLDWLSGLSDTSQFRATLVTQYFPCSESCAVAIDTGGWANTLQEAAGGRLQSLEFWHYTDDGLFRRIFPSP